MSVGFLHTLIIYGYLATVVSPSRCANYYNANETNSQRRHAAVLVNIEFRLVATLISLVGALANLPLLAYVRRYRLGGAISTRLVRWQAVADIADSVAAPAFLLWRSLATVSDIPLPVAVVVCYVWLSGFLDSAIHAFSVYTLVATGLDRYVAVCHPFRYVRANVDRVTRWTLTALFGLALGYAGITLSFVRLLDVVSPARNITTHKCALLALVPGGPSKTAMKHIGFCVRVAVNVGLPVVLLAALHCRVIAVLRSRVAGSPALKSVAARRFTLAVVTITAVVTAANTVYYSIFFVSIVMGRDRGGGGSLIQRPPVFTALAMLAATNAAVNPIVYMVIIDRFRHFVMCSSAASHGSISASSDA